MEEFSPMPCPSTVTVRRNPPRKARATPYTTAAKPPPSSNTHDVPSFPIDEILSIQIPQPEPEPKPSVSVSESLKIFLRIKPLRVFSKATAAAKSRPRNVWPQNPSKKHNVAKESRSKKSEEACITLNDSHSVTLTPPQALQELKRSKTEVFEGFSHVFPADCSQSDVYGKMVQPLLEDFLNGKSGMLAALGPSGSGKTHTVFGTPKDPGVVPLTLRQIFKKRDETSSPVSLRLFHLSIFEICSERGKGEKAYDLLGDGSSELSVQQSTIRGLKEVPIRNLEEAESLIGQAMLKRATATTNSNSQSSRSQCIINIRAASDGVSNETTADAMLTIVDLAGAEREKRTGNQGERLVESNFINNTSMVFGQCLRSLLEYQKNRKKGLQKHHQNSLLTRYLRDYLEGKRRMALIITVKAGEEDYLDTSYLLKQASPYMKIKFDNTEEVCNKRQLKTFPRVEKNKKMKLSAPKTSQIAETVAGEKNQITQEVNLEGKKADQTEKSSPKLEDNNDREHIIMRNFAKVVWNVLKQYNEKLKVAEGDICTLKESLKNEQLKSRGLEAELINLKSNLAEPCLPEVEALVHAKEQIETNVDDDDPCDLIESRSEVTADGCNESPVVPNKSVVPGLGNEEISSEEQKCAKQDDPCNLIDSTSEVTAEGCNESPVPNKNVVPDLANEQECDIQINPTPSPEQAEVSLINNRLSNIQTKSAVSRRFPDSEKQERHRRLLPASSRLLAEEMDDLEIKDKQIEKPQVKLTETRDGKKTESTKSREIEIPAREAEPASTKKQRNEQKKPRRRLQPASSVLLTREINTLEIEDDVAEPKGTRGGKKTTVTQPRSQGSVTLLRLLTSNLHL
ncbi:PREDICTED: kinesin-like protein KIF22 isoform X2 [Brassica oleracea var. oleracea]|uniref:kinesin-like protein KIF22 isoform X2 n=1 Tax=Brassica oleracea var. oleracea TaxID=109376 RepID=UPI0006A7242F|nr:PREDICTED: kinesin-like protein KIF22 isoform X2 [Brassica oleracea var. oleracea]